MILKNITLRNFLSIGAVCQAVNFDNKDLTLILGENLDLGGAGNRNGTGKTTLIQGISYALFGEPINNIRKDNLINRTNGKGMLVTLEFTVGDIDYKIERGRKPNVLKFYVNNKTDEGTESDSQGENKETQEHIEKIINMSSEMFRQIVVLNTYSEPFLGMKVSDQRLIIEQLLGVTLLSEKADALREQIKGTKASIQEEEYKIKATEEANKRITEQIENLKRRQSLWDRTHDDDIKRLTQDLGDLKKIDIEAELAGHIELTKYNQKKRDLSELEKAISRTQADIQKENKTLSVAIKEIVALEEHRCHACGQEIHDDQHTAMLAEKQKIKTDSEQLIAENTALLSELIAAKTEIGELGKLPKLYYDTEQQAYKHKNTVEMLMNKIEEKQKETNPYTDQISDMENKALQVIDYTNMNNFTKLLDHQKFLLDLLTNKDSFVRKRIIDQNLSYLNARLTHYLEKIGLPHQVKFLNDLSVEITELGREMDFYNLSRGEMNRVILSLSWAFRDVYENLYNKINVLFIDELLDNGTDSMGMENSLTILKDMARNRGKSVWLISHKDELASRVNSVLKVVKQNGFTSYSTTTDVE